MQSKAIAVFETSVQEFARSCTRTTTEGFNEALDEVIEEPAVGVSLPFDGISLAETGVTTDPTAAEIRTAESGVTAAGLGVANYGTFTVHSRENGDELISLYPKRHVVVIGASDIVPDMATAFGRLSEDFDSGDDTQVLTTGISATGDLGGLVHGVHGPERIDAIVLEDR